MLQDFIKYSGVMYTAVYIISDPCGEGNTNGMWHLARRAYFSAPKSTRM